MPAWVLAPLTLAVIYGALRLNQQIVGFLPEDPPGKGRKNHPDPTPMVGVVVVPLLVLWLLLHGHWWLAAGTAVAGAVGGWDDAKKIDGRELGWMLKALGLLVAATLGALECGLPAELPVSHWVGLGALLFVTINALNFLDNTDGVAASLAAVGLGAAGGDLAAGGFAALGVLPYNWPRAAVFCGDALALPLGLWLGATAVTGGAIADGVALPLCLPCVAAPIAIVLLDFVQVVSMRLYLGIPPWIGDRRHLTHIATQVGLPRPLVAPLFALAAGALYWLLSRWNGA